MSYIGKVELKASDIKRDSGTIVGTPSTVTLNFTAANSNSLLFYLNVLSRVHLCIPSADLLRLSRWQQGHSLLQIHGKLSV